MTRSPYEVLQVPPTASRDEVHRAYRRLIKRWHPDRRPHDPMATRRLQAINEAYDAVRRAPQLPPPAEPESILWRAAACDAVIVLTSRRLMLRHGGGRCDVPLSAIRRVDLKQRASAAVTICVRTRDRTRVVIRLPAGQARRLAELLDARTRA